MKKYIPLIFSLLLSHYSFGQNCSPAIYHEIDLPCFVPTDIDSFWHTTEGCRSVIMDDAQTYMDTFRVLFRKPFSRYLLGDYYCGTILKIDSITSTSPFVNIANDSLCFVYVNFNVKEQFFSPYNQDIYCSPIPDDIRYDRIHKFQYYKQLQHFLDDTNIIQKKICIMMTKQEVDLVTHDESFLHTKEILLRMTSYDVPDSSRIIFCFQPFLEGYSKEYLLTKRQIGLYKMTRYRQLYYDLFKKDFPSTE